MLNIKFKIRFNFAGVLSILICVYIVGLCLGTATQFIHNDFDIIITLCITLFQILQILLSSLVRQRISNLLKHNLLFDFAAMWCIIGSLLYLFYFDGNSIRMLVYRTMIISVFTIMIIVLNTKSEEDVYKYMKAMIFGMLINYGISIYELTTHLHIGKVLGPHMLNSTFVGLSNNNNYATFLLYCLPFIFILFSLKKRDLKEKTIFLIILSANFYFNYKTGSNTGIAGSALIIMMGICVNWLYKKFDAKSLKILAILFSFFYVILFGGIIVLGITGADLGGGRILYIHRAGNEFVNTLGAGLGPGGSQVVNGGWIHNLLLELLYEYGVLVFLVFYACWLKILIKINGQYKNRHISGYVFVFVLLLPIIWISSSSAMSLHFTWVNFALLFQYFCDRDIIPNRILDERKLKH